MPINKKYNSGKETIPRTFSNMLENFFGKDLFEESQFGSFVPAVNVRENKDNYQIEVAAPGMKKDDFNINVDNDVLTISAETREEKEEEDEKYTRREFNYSSFSRSFNLPDTVNTDNVSAKYNDGVLIISLPKKEEAKERPKKNVKID